MTITCKGLTAVYEINVYPFEKVTSVNPQAYQVAIVGYVPGQAGYNPGYNNLTYGQVLDTLKLQGKFMIPGTNTFVEGQLMWQADNSVLETGIHTVEWVFIPADERKYESCEGSLKVVVNKAGQLPNCQQLFILRHTTALLLS